MSWLVSQFELKYSKTWKALCDVLHLNDQTGLNLTNQKLQGLPPLPTTCMDSNGLLSSRLTVMEWNEERESTVAVTRSFLAMHCVASLQWFLWKDKRNTSGEKKNRLGWMNNSLNSKGLFCCCCCCFSSWISAWFTSIRPSTTCVSDL